MYSGPTPIAIVRAAAALRDAIRTGDSVAIGRWQRVLRQLEAPLPTEAR